MRRTELEIGPPPMWLNAWVCAAARAEGAPSERGATGGRVSATASRASRGRSTERHDGSGYAWLNGEQGDQASAWSPPWSPGHSDSHTLARVFCRVTRHHGDGGGGDHGGGWTVADLSKRSQNRGRESATMWG